jgi:hypothetical protein
LTDQTRDSINITMCEASLQVRLLSFGAVKNFCKWYSLYLFMCEGARLRLEPWMERLD